MISPLNIVYDVYAGVCYFCWYFTSTELGPNMRGDDDNVEEEHYEGEPLPVNEESDHADNINDDDDHLRPPVMEEEPSLFSLAGLLDAAGFLASVAFAPVHWTASCPMIMASLPVLAVVSATTTAYKTTCALLSLPSTIVQGLQCMADVLIASYW